MIVWGRVHDMQQSVANAPDRWYMNFAAIHPEHIRKFGVASNSTLLFRASGVLDAIERGETFRVQELQDGEGEVHHD